MVWNTSQVQPEVEEEDIFASPEINTSGIDAQTAALLQALQPKDYDESREKYAGRFGAVIEPRRKLNFYDLAGELGRAILSRPADEGVFPGLGVGFGNFQKRLSRADEEERKQRQQIALKAAELAMTDERAADKMLQQFSMDILKNQLAGKEVKLITLKYDEVDPKTGTFTGNKVEGSFDKVTQGPLIRRLITQQGGIDVSALPDPIGESKTSEELGKKWAQSEAEVRESNKIADASLDMVNRGKRLATKIGPGGFGISQAWLLPFKNFVIPFVPDGLIDVGAVGSQQSLAQITMSFVLSNIAKTKGAISEKEMDLFEKASPHLGQTYEGFMLALDIQESIAKKILLFSAEYQARVNEVMKADTTGYEIKTAMDEFVTRWEKENRDLFLTDDHKKQIAAYTQESKDKGFAGDYTAYQDRYKSLMDKQNKQEERKTDAVILQSEGGWAQDMIKQIVADSSLNAEEKAELIFKIKQQEN